MFVTLHESPMCVVVNGQGLMQVKTIDCRHISGNVLI